CSYNLFIFFIFKRASGINQPSSWSNMCQCGSENSNLSLLQVWNVFRLEAPLDLRIARQGAGAGAWHIGQNPVKISSERKLPGISSKHLNIGVRRHLA